MAINVDHSGALAGRTATLAFRGGQAQYLENRRREEAQRQMDLLRMQQQQQQFNQNLANQQFQAAQNRQQQFNMLGATTAMDMLAQNNRFQNQTALMDQQNQQIMERDNHRNENYRESLRFRQNLQSTLQTQRANASLEVPQIDLPEVIPSGPDMHRVLTDAGRAEVQKLKEQQIKVQEAAMSGATPEVLQQAQEKLQQRVQQFEANAEQFYAPPQRVPGSVYSQNGRRYQVDQKGMSQPIGMTDEYFQQWGSPESFMNQTPVRFGNRSYIREPKGTDGDWQWKELPGVDDIETRKAESDIKKNEVANFKALSDSLRQWLPDPPKMETFLGRTDAEGNPVDGTKQYEQAMEDWESMRERHYQLLMSQLPSTRPGSNAGVMPGAFQQPAVQGTDNFIQDAANAPREAVGLGWSMANHLPQHHTWSPEERERMRPHLMHAIGKLRAKYDSIEDMKQNFRDYGNFILLSNAIRG